MAEKEKISTLVLTVDLDCYICSKKIRKTIFKLQGRESIQTVAYEEKNNTVIISGPFDPQRLKKKILCKAGKVVKEIKEEKKPPPVTKNQTKPAEPEKPKPAQVMEKPKEENNKPKEKEKEKTKPAEPEKPKPAEPDKPKPKVPEPEPSKPVVLDYQPFWPSGPAVPSCCWRPCYVDYYGGCRCSSCGMFFEWTAGSLPPAGGYRGGSSTYQFFCEEDPSCSIM